MKTSPQENAQQWIESWKRASVALKAVKRHELRTYDLAKKPGDCGWNVTMGL